VDPRGIVVADEQRRDPDTVPGGAEVLHVGADVVEQLRGECAAVDEPMGEGAGHGGENPNVNGRAAFCAILRYYAAYDRRARAVGRGAPGGDPPPPGGRREGPRVGAERRSR